MVTLMTPVSEENQLELFNLEGQPAPKPHRELVGHVRLQLRFDQFILASVVGIISLTVIFACGVERGKQIARYEGSALTRRQAQDDGFPAHSNSALEPQPAIPAVPAAPSTATKLTPLLAPASSVDPKAKTPGKPVAPRSRYAVQVVTFSRPILAKQELDRLQSRGERAFLIIRDGRTAVYVGPFTSKSHASVKVSTLKSTYQDCFIKAL